MKYIIMACCFLMCACDIGMHAKMAAYEDSAEDAPTESIA